MKNTLKVKIIFHQLFLSLLGYVLPFFAPESKKGKAGSINEIFHVDEYLESLDASQRDFMKEFVKTQSFLAFLEKFYLARKQENEVSFFVQASQLYKSLGETAYSAHLTKAYSAIMYNFKHVNFIKLYFVSLQYSRLKIYLMNIKIYAFTKK